MINYGGWVKDVFSRELGIEKITPVSGGSTALGFKLQGYGSNYFLKINPHPGYRDMLEKEALSLKVLENLESIKVPKVHHVGRQQNVDYMLMDWIDRREPDTLFWENFGIEMAMLHQKKYPFYGFITDNYIGTLRQSNLGCTTWAEFFIEHRLVPLVGEAFDRDVIDQLTVQKFEALYNRVSDIFEEEQASLIHGDFWYGNYMCDSQAKPVLIDPASYFGNRVMDIAMSQLFGGFPDVFYHAYNAIWHLPPGWKESVEIANLYPLLVHANMFGGSYGQMIKNILYRF